MRLSKRIFAMTAGGALFAAGCALHSPVDAEWGNAHQANRAAQHADPDAPRATDPAEGIDPISSELVADRYYKGQRTQETRRAPGVMITEGR